MLPILYVYRNYYANSACCCCPHSNYPIVKKNTLLDIVNIILLCLKFFIMNKFEVIVGNKVGAMNFCVLYYAYNFLQYLDMFQARV